MTEPAQLRLKGGQIALIDARDAERLSKYTYRLSSGEVIRTLPRPDKRERTTRALKHDVLGRCEVAVGYHSGDVLDNRRENLKVLRDPKKSHATVFDALPSISSRAGIYTGTKKFHSEVMGVTYRKDRANSKPWRVRIQTKVNGVSKPLYLGHFATREEAEQTATRAYGKSA